jgi:nicotinamide phosphoribosyltransferase
MKTNNILFKTDSYKISHPTMYPEGTVNNFGYFESRNGAEIDETVFVGLQYVMIEHLQGQLITSWKIDEAEELYKHHFNDDTVFNREPWEYILREHGGRLPIRIKAVPEGTPIPTSNILLSVEILDEKCQWVLGWLTNYLDSLLTQLWYPCTVASRSRELKKIVKTALDKSCMIPDVMLPYMIHDFGFRGTTGVEAASIGGFGHLVNFLGTDTVMAMVFARDYYNGELNNLGKSVRATEHSISTGYGKNREKDYVLETLKKHPNGIISMVSDTYNITNFVDKVIRECKEEILQRWFNGKAQLNKLVIRPDSKRWEGDTPHSQIIWILETLWDIFGGKVNEKGYRELHPAVGVIYGDGLTKDEIKSIYNNVTNHFNFKGKIAFDASAVVCGQGGGLLQKLNRDTQKFAFKSSAQKRNDTWYDVQKEPLDKMKSSKTGRLALIKENGKYQTIREDELGDRENILQTVFEMGTIQKFYNLEEVRKNSEI